MAHRLIIRDRQQTNPADMCSVVVDPASTQGEVGAHIKSGWTHSRLSSPDVPHFHRTYDRGEGNVWCAPELIPFFLKKKNVCPYSLPSHLNWQTLWRHIIWVISLYFYAADVSPCQQAPWQSKMENPPLLKCCTWVSPFLPLWPHQPLGSPHGTPSPRPVPMVEKKKNTF